MKTIVEETIDRMLANLDGQPDGNSFDLKAAALTAAAAVVVEHGPDDPFARDSRTRTDDLAAAVLHAMYAIAGIHGPNIDVYASTPPCMATVGHIRHMNPAEGTP